MSKKRHLRHHRVVRAGAPVRETEAQPPSSVNAAPAPVAAPPATQAGKARGIGDYRPLIIGVSLALVALVVVLLAGSTGTVSLPSPERTAVEQTPDDLFAGIDRNDVSALMLLGKQLYDQNRFEDAVRVYQEVIRLAPNNQAAHSNLGSAYFRLQRVDEAMESFRTAVRINPNDAEARQNLGAGLAALGNFEDAIKEYEQAVQLKPDLAIPHYSLGILYQETGKPDKAIAELRRYLELGTDQTWRADAQRRLEALGAE